MMRRKAEKDFAVKARLKRWLLPRGSSPRVIRSGLLRGLRMEMDLAHRSQRWLGLEERELDGPFQELSRDIQTAVDVGASDGRYTLYFLAKTPARKVLAFEPSPENLSRLRGNLERNRFGSDPRLELVPKFVGIASGDACVSLDTFLESITPPCLVKVDIDGGEVALLEGAPRLLRLPEVRWIIEVHSNELGQRCLEILRSAGYHSIVVRNAWWRVFLPELRPCELNHWLVAAPAGPPHFGKP